MHSCRRTVIVQLYNNTLQAFFKLLNTGFYCSTFSVKPDLYCEERTSEFLLAYVGCYGDYADVWCEVGLYTPFLGRGIYCDRGYVRERATACIGLTSGRLHSGVLISNVFFSSGTLHTRPFGPRGEGQCFPLQVSHPYCFVSVQIG